MVCEVFISAYRAVHAEPDGPGMPTQRRNFLTLLQPQQRRGEIVAAQPRRPRYEVVNRGLISISTSARAIGRLTQYQIDAHVT